MFDFSNCLLQQVSIHWVGNKTNGDTLILTDNCIQGINQLQETLLMQYFLKPFTNVEFYNFTFSNNDFKLNPLYQFTACIFKAPNDFHEQSKNIARHLFDVSEHPNIKTGDVFIAELSGIIIDGATVDGIGIFKSENKQPYLQLNRSSGTYTITNNEGLHIDKLDKGCIILNSNSDEGYRVCVIDKSNHTEEAHYWKDSFLNLKPCSDEYHKTKDFLSVARQYVTNQLPEEFEVTKTDKIDLLNRSVSYFKENENFNKQEFENQVFQQPELIESFRKFDDMYREEMDLTPAGDAFEISNQAVKNQSRVFKSVLKLDKNFHVYIHGDKSLIERGTENDGRKYYKIYYDEEK